MATTWRVREEPSQDRWRARSVGEGCWEVGAGRRPQLLARMREALRSRHYSRRTEQTYCQWIKRFIDFQKVRHPSEMAESEINAFLTPLAVNETVSASTQNQALSALLFLYRHVIGREIGDLGDVIRARSPNTCLRS